MPIQSTGPLYGSNLFKQSYQTDKRCFVDNLSTHTKTHFAAGYSTRLLYSGYAGPSISVQRTFDNTSSDFYSDENGNLNTTNNINNAQSLITWLNGSVGLVKILYDQSGNGRHLNQVYGNTYITPSPIKEMITAPSSNTGLFGLNRLSYNYTGPTITLRRASDNAIKDFYADVTGQLGFSVNGTGTSFYTWASTGNTYAVIWWDQSGNGNHATQFTNSVQPYYNQTLTCLDFSSQINSWMTSATAGTSYTYGNGTPTFTGTGTLGIPKTANSTYSFVFKHGYTGTHYFASTSLNSTSGNVLYMNSSSYYVNDFSTSTSANTLVSLNQGVGFNTQAVITNNGTTRNMYFNGILNNTSASISYTVGSGAQYIGRDPTGTLFMNTQLFYMYFFNTALSDPDRIILTGYDITTPGYNIHYLGNNALYTNYFPGTNVCEYPPNSLITSNSTTVSGQFSAYNGTYTASASTTNSTFSAFNAFKEDTTSFWESGLNYSTSSGNYVGTATQTTDINSNVYTGDYLQIQLPTAILLKCFSMAGRQDQTFYLSRTPRNFVLLGSNNGSSWTLLHSEGSIINWGTADKIFYCNVSNGISFSYYRIVVMEICNSYSGNNVNGGSIVVNLTRFKLNPATPIPRGSPNYSFLINYTPMNSTSTSSYQWISGQGSAVNNQFGGLSTLNLTIGMPGNSNDVMFVPIANNISRKSVLTVNNNNSTNNITIYDNNNNWQNTSPAVGSLVIGNLSLTIGCNPINSSVQLFQGIINEVLVFTNTLSINDASLYNISASTITQITENPIPKTIIRFNNKDTQILPGYTPVVMLSLDTLQNANQFNNHWSGSNNATQIIKTWNDFTATGTQQYIAVNGFTDYNAPGSNGIGATGYWPNIGYLQSSGTSLLNGGSRTFNLNSRGGFTAVCIIYSQSNNTNERVFDFGNSSYTNNIVAWRPSGSSSMGFAIYSGGVQLAQAVTANGVYQNTEWAVWAFRYTNSTRFFEIFKNGVQVATATGSTTAADVTLPDTYLQFNQANSVYSQMALTGFAAYDYSLSNTDIGSVIQYLMYSTINFNGPLSQIPDANNLTRVGQIYNVSALYNTAARFYGNGYYDMTDVPDLSMSFNIKFCIHRNLASGLSAQASLWSISGTTLTLTTVSSGTFYVGMTLFGTGISGPCTIIAITSSITGNSGTVCTLSTTQTTVSGSTNILNGVLTTMTILGLCDQLRNGGGLNIDYDIKNYRLVFNSQLGSTLINYINGVYTNVWYNLTIVCTANYQILVYLNGLLQCTQTGTSNMTARSRFILGDSGNTALAQPYFGYFKDFKIYDYALRADQILQLYYVPYSPKLLTYNSPSHSLVNRGNWYNVMQYNGKFRKPDPFAMVQTGSFYFGGGNIYQYNRVQDYQSFRCSFDYLCNNPGADTDGFYVGTNGPMYRTDGSPGVGMVINFALFSSHGIWMWINGEFVKYTYILEYRQNEWTNVVITYNRSNINTWVITINGIDIYTYHNKNNDYWRTTSGNCWGFSSGTGGQQHNGFFRNVELDFIPYVDQSITNSGVGLNAGNVSGYSLSKLVKGGFSSGSVGSCRGQQRGLVDGLTWKLYDGFAGTSNYSSNPLLYIDFTNSASYPGTGTTVYDLSGNGYNYTLTNSPVYSGGYLTFNSASSQYLASPAFGLLLTLSITIEVWISPSGVGIVIDERASGYNATVIEINTSQINARLWALSPLNLGPWVSGNWYHIVLTYNGSTQAGYVNGVLMASNTGTRSPPGTTEQYHFGFTDGTNMGTSSYFNGTLGQMKLYNTALNANQILQNYNKLVSPINTPITITTTGASGTSTIATLTFSTQIIIPYLKGTYITVTGVTPVGYNGTYVVTTCTTTSVSFSSTVTGSQTVAGTITYTDYNYNYINTNYFLLNKYQAIGRTNNLTNLQTITTGQIPVNSAPAYNTTNTSGNLFQQLSSGAQSTCRALYDLIPLNNSYTGPLIKLRNNSNLVLQDFYSDINGNLTTGAGGSGSTFDSWYNTNCLGNYTVPPKASTWVASGTSPFTWTTNIYKTTNTTLNGIYTITSSNEYNRSDLYAYHLFDNITAGVPNLWHTADAIYNATTGVYNGSTTTTVSGTGYLGEWVQLQVPNAINITSFTIYGWDNINYYKRNPTKFVFAGSNNGTTWTDINISTQTTAATWVQSIPQTFSGDSSTYTYFRLIVTNIMGGYDGFANIARLILNTNISGATEPSPVYVNTWYDQSGNSIHATQPIFGFQPVYNNVANYLEFTTTGGSISYLNMGSSGNSTSPQQSGNPYYTYIVKHGNVNIGTLGAFISAGALANNNEDIFYVHSNGLYYSQWYNNDGHFGTYASGNTVTLNYDGTNRNCFMNGVSSNVFGSSNHSIPVGQQYIGIQTNMSIPLNGQLRSIYIFSSISNSAAALSTSDRTLCENVQNQSNVNLSLELTGYFLAPVTDTFTFSVNSVDDTVYGWVGSTANIGYTTNNYTFNAILNNGVLTTNPGSVSLTAGVYYPFRMMYSQNTSVDNLNLTFTRSTHLINRMSSAGQTAARGLYALFLLRSGYSGFVIRLRSNIGSVTQDFYATKNGLLTTGSGGTGTNYTTWLTQNNSTFAYVSIWYDQSTFGFNATQSTTTLQPVYDGNYLDFGIQSNSFLNMGSATGATSPFANGTNSPFTFVVKHNNLSNLFSSSTGIFGAGATSGSNNQINFRMNSNGNGTSYYLYFNSDDAFFGTFNPENIVSFTFDGTNKNSYINGSSQPTGQVASGGYTLTDNQQYIGKTTFNQYFNGQMNSFMIFNTALSSSDLTIVNDQNISDGSGYFFSSLGSNINYPAESAKVIKDLCGTNLDGSYYINVNGTSTPVYCLMNDIYEGGGWMMLMKGIRGNTFSWNTSYWNDHITLKSTDISRLPADAKYNTLNYSYISDVMAIFPDINSTSYTNVFGKNGGSLNLPDGWSWKVNNWNDYAPLLQQLSASGQSSARGLYSLLRVNNNYTGPCIRLRNNANTVTQDFYASVTGQLGTSWDATGTSYSTWYTANGGAANVYVTVWYDQSGNGFHATQTVTTLQPRFVYVAVATASIFNSYLDFGTQTNSFLNMGTVNSGPFQAGTNLPFTTIIKHGSVTGSGSGFYGAGTSANNQCISFRLNGTTGYNLYFFFDDNSFTSYASGNIVTFKYGATTNSRNAYVNNTSSTTTNSHGTGGYTLSGNFQQTIGRTVANEYLNGQIYNLYIFGSALSDNDRTVMENKGTNYAVQTAFASNYIQSKCTGLTGFQISRDAGNCANPLTFPGYSTNLFSYQNVAYNHTFGSGIHNYYGSTDSYTRWGVLNNNQGDFATVEALSGIGLNYSNGTVVYSAGDYAAGGGAPVTNLNRSTRFEMYGR